MTTTKETIVRSDETLRRAATSMRERSARPDALTVADLLDVAAMNYDPEFPEDAEAWDFYRLALAVASTYLNDIDGCTEAPCLVCDPDEWADRRG